MININVIQILVYLYYKYIVYLLKFKRVLYFLKIGVFDVE